MASAPALPQPQEATGLTPKTEDATPEENPVAAQDSQDVSKQVQSEDRNQAGESANNVSDSPPDTTQPSEEAKTDDVDEVEDVETLRSLKGQLRSSMYPLTDQGDFLQRQRKAGGLDKRSTQALLHGTLTHMRINELENQLRELQTILKGKGPDWKHTEEVEKFPVHLPQLRRTAPSDFAQTMASVRLPVSQQAAIEVSVGRGSQIVQTIPELNDQATSEPSDRITPERIVIRSRALLAHLDNILDSRLMNSVGDDEIDRDSPRVYYSLVFLRPFRFFAVNEEKIRKSVSEVAKRLEPKPTADLELEQQSSIGTAKSASLGDDQKLYKDEDLMNDLNLLIECFDSDLKSLFDLRKKVKAGTDTDIEYEDLWHVFQRGDIIVSRHSPDHAFRLLNVAGGREPLTSSGSGSLSERFERAKAVDGFALDCYSLTNDGVSYVPLLDKFNIRRFFGTQRITELPYFPLKFHPDAARLTDEMTTRGQMFVEMTRKPFQHMLAKGKTRNEPRQDVDTQVIVDILLALNAEPTWRPPSDVTQDNLTEQDPRETVQKAFCGHGMGNCCGSDSLHMDYIMEEEDLGRYLMSLGGGLFRPLAASELTEEHYMLMRPFVHAFVLRSREWVTVNVWDLSAVEFESSFEDLRIPKAHKKVVQALVKTHEAGQQGEGGFKAHSIGASMDIVKGKGRGLIILLHGAPGVGKTSTAECVADNTRRPLYPITCGDIGETALEVEKNLHDSFQLAQKWGCVLLLDEADVFLTKRTRSDLRHNAVTSVFLRSLEYYSGILFLTTNRVGIMDQAFKSRIQMTLFYPKLARKVTLQLYRMFIERVKKEQKERGAERFKINEKEIMKFAKNHYDDLEEEGLDTWNGRQIRNAFQTAIALVEYDATLAKPGDPVPVLGKDYFKSVAKSAKKFDEYLTATTGKSEADAARLDSWRDDSFGAGGAGGAGYIPVTPVKSVAVHQPTSRKGKKKRSSSSSDDTDSDSGSDESGSEDESDSESQSEEERKSRSKKSKSKSKSKKAASKSPKRRSKE